MNRLLTILFTFTITMLGIASPAGAQVKVGVCHRNASETNPYVYIEVPEDQANGHITGTSKQHNHSVTWPEDGTWRGVPHLAGDERLDYFASDKSECEDTEPPVDPPTVIELPATPEVLDPCGTGNATWVLPEDTDVLDWTLSPNGLLFVNTIGNVTFPVARRSTTSASPWRPTSRTAPPSRRPSARPSAARSRTPTAR